MRPARFTKTVLSTVTLLASTLSLGVPVSTACADEPAPATAAADVLVLKDGRRLEGLVVAETDDAVTFRAGGATRMYARTDVDRIERSAAPAPGGVADTPAPPAGTAPSPAPAPDKKKDAFGKKGKVLTDAARTWIRDLARSAEVEDEQVRRSVAAALRALGPVAVPSILEAASASATPGVKEFLERVAAEMSGGKKDGPRPAATADGTPPEPGMQGPSPGAPGGAPPAPGVAPGGPPEGRRPGRAALDKLSADLELRDEQRPKMGELMGGLERKQFALLREVKQGGIAADQVTTRVDALRKETLDAARTFLDVPQYDLFEEHARRYFDGILTRAVRGEGRPADPQAPVTPPAPKAGE